MGCGKPRKTARIPGLWALIQVLSKKRRCPTADRVQRTTLLMVCISLNDDRSRYDMRQSYDVTQR
jgi:hypothetical protein